MHLSFVCYLFFGDQWACNARPKQVLSLVNGIGTEHREHVVANKFLPKILHEHVFRADTQLDGLLPCRLQLFALTQIRCERHHLVQEKSAISVGFFFTILTLDFFFAKFKNKKYGKYSRMAHLAVVCALKPFDDHRRVQSA